MWDLIKLDKTLENVAKQGDSPVVENLIGPRGIPSTTGHEKSAGNLGGPPSKAKYY
jgi:hypothetical protein